MILLDFEDTNKCHAQREYNDLAFCILESVIERRYRLPIDPTEFCVLSAESRYVD
jgi:hypothetical protein